jgi:hypothetical protein
VNYALELDAIRQQIRSYAPFLGPDPADLLCLAVALQALDPDRKEPIWTFLVGSTGVGKDSIVSLFGGWKHAWPLPAMTKGLQYLIDFRVPSWSRLERCKMVDRLGNGPRRLIVAPNLQLHSFFADRNNKLNSTTAVWDGIYEGRVEYGAARRVYRCSFEPHERLNFLGACSSVHDWSRDTLNATGYWMPYRMLRQVSRAVRGGPKDLTSTAMDFNSRRLALEPHVRQQTADSLMRFLEIHAARLGRGELASVEMGDTLRHRLLTAAEFCRRLGTVDAVDDDYGDRLFRAAEHLARLAAFMRGADWVEEYDAEIAFRLIVSQVVRVDWWLLRYQLDMREARALNFSEVAEQRFITRERILAGFSRLARAGVCDSKIDGHGRMSIKLTAKARATLASVDPERVLFPPIGWRDDADGPAEPEAELQAADREPQFENAVDASDFIRNFGV